MRIIFLLASLVAIGPFLFAQNLKIVGRITDKKTIEPLPYVQVMVKGTDKGCLTNIEGEFELMFPASAGDTLMVSFMGFKSIKLQISKMDLSNPLDLKMETDAFQLDEVIVSPHPPIYYIKQSMVNLPDYYSLTTHNSVIFSRELVKINGEFYSLNESLLKGYFQPFVSNTGDTSRVKVLAYRQFTNKDVGKDLIDEKKSDKRVKKEEKANVKRAKKGEKVEEIKTDEEQMYESFKAMFSSLSPYQLWDSTLIRGFYKDSTSYNEGHYTQGRMLHEDDRQIMEIKFHDKKKEEKSSGTGYVLLDYESLAFREMRIEFSPSGAKWGAIKTALFLFGYNVHFLTIHVTYRYKEVNGTYIPNHTSFAIKASFEKMHIFTKNEPFNIEVNTDNVVLESQNPSNDLCKDGTQLSRKKHISDQFKSEFGATEWEKYKGVIKPEKVFSK